MSIDNHLTDFEKMVKDAGIPITELEMQQHWDAINKDQGTRISNDSNWSPFWRLISAIVTKPAIWVVNFLIQDLLPNSFIKTAKDKPLDILAWSLNLERKKGEKSKGAITFYREQINMALTIPAGTRIQSITINGMVYELKTIRDATMDVGEKNIDITAEAPETGSAWNLAPGYYTSLPEPIDTITQVINNENWIITLGANDESNDELRLRCQNQFTAVGQFHHDAAYKAIIGQFAGLRMDYIWFQHGAPRGPGSANAYLMVDSGPAPADLVKQVNQHINDHGFHGHGDDMDCFPMPAKKINLTATVFYKAGLSDEKTNQLSAGIEQMIRSAFRENQNFNVTRTWPFNRFSFSKLDQEIHDQFPDLLSIEFSLGDIVTQMELAMLESLKVNTGGVSK